MEREFTLAEKVDQVRSKDDLCYFVHELLRDYMDYPHMWENPTLDRFLSAMKFYLESMERYYKGEDTPFPSEPSWNMLAQILLAGRDFE